MRPGFIITILIAGVVSLQLASLYAVTQAARAGDHEQAMLSSVHTLESYTKNLNNQIQQFLSPIDTQLSISRQLAIDGLMNTQDNRTLELFFLSQLRSNASMNAMYLGRYDGSFVAVVRFKQSLLNGYDGQVMRAKVVSVSEGVRKIQWREYSVDGHVLSQWSDHEDTFDPRMLDWYQSAHDHDEPVWTNAFSLTKSNSLAIAASVNLKSKQSDDVGVLGVSVELSELNRLVANLSSGQQISTVVLDNQSNTIAESKHNTNTIEPELPFDQLSSTQDINKHWFSHGEGVANVLRRIELFDGALQWRVLTQTKVPKRNTLVELGGDGYMYRIIAVIVLPGLVAIMCLVGLSKRLQRLHLRATVDYLTKAYNREEFLGRFIKRLHTSRLRRSRRERWVGILLDLDGFKQINDHYGHDAGDAILTTVVARLEQIVGRAGFVGRLGGDEFAVALRIKPKVNANEVVEKIRHSVVKKPIASARAQHQIGMTAGVAVADATESVEQLLERADRALVAGKSIAKNATYGASKQPSADDSAMQVIVGRDATLAPSS